MKFVRTKEDLIENIRTLESYLNSDNQTEQQFARDLIRRGKTILVYKVNGENHFAPSRFLGYAHNTMDAHITNGDKDGRDTNPVIDKALNLSSFSNEQTESKFLHYVEILGVQAENNKRRYWRLKDSRGKNFNLS